MVKKGFKELIAEAETVIETITAEEAVKLASDESTVFVDLRDIRELYREGRIPGSVHAPRGMLEFWVDPESPYHKEIFASGKRLYCTAQLAGDQLWLLKRFTIWAWKISVISVVATMDGKNTAVQQKQLKRSNCH